MKAIKESIEKVLWEYEVKAEKGELHIDDLPTIRLLSETLYDVEKALGVIDKGKYHISPETESASMREKSNLGY